MADTPAQIDLEISPDVVKDNSGGPLLTTNTTSTQEVKNLNTTSPAPSQPKEEDKEPSLFQKRLKKYAWFSISLAGNIPLAALGAFAFISMIPGAGGIILGLLATLSAIYISAMAYLEAEKKPPADQGGYNDTQTNTAKARSFTIASHLINAMNSASKFLGSYFAFTAVGSSVGLGFTFLAVTGATLIALLTLSNAYMIYKLTMRTRVRLMAYKNGVKPFMEEQPSNQFVKLSSEDSASPVSSPWYSKAFHFIKKHAGFSANMLGNIGFAALGVFGLIKLIPNLGVAIALGLIATVAAIFVNAVVFTEVEKGELPKTDENPSPYMVQKAKRFLITAHVMNLFNTAAKFLGGYLSFVAATHSIHIASLGLSLIGAVFVAMMILSNTKLAYTLSHRGAKRIDSQCGETETAVVKGKPPINGEALKHTNEDQSKTEEMPAPKVTESVTEEFNSESCEVEGPIARQGREK